MRSIRGKFGCHVYRETGEGIVAGKPGSKEEHAASEEWAKKHVRSAVAQKCKEHQHAIAKIDRGEEEHW